MQELDFDVIIAGAGPAGCTAVLALQNSGLRVAVVDKSVFPRDKICGDSVGVVAKRILRQLDPQLELDLSQFGAKTNIRNARLYSPDFKTLDLQFVKEGHCIRRRDFDQWLFTRAQSNPNARFFMGVAVADARTDSEKATLTLSDGSVLRADLILGCDGAQSVVARKLAGFKVNRRHYSGAVRRYYRNIAGLDGKTLEVYFLKDHLPGYFWIFPLSDNEANVGFGMLSETIAHKKIDLKVALDDIVNQIPEIRERFEGAIALEETKGFGLPLGGRKNPISGNRFMLCGDAASLIDPFSGEGISTAMESARFAADQVMACFDKRDFSAHFLSAYDERVYRKMLKPFRQHRFLQQWMGNRIWLISLIIRIGRIPVIQRNITKVFY